MVGKVVVHTLEELHRVIQWDFVVLALLIFVCTLIVLFVVMASRR